MFVIKICHSYEQFYITVTKKKLSYEMHQYDKQCLLLLQKIFISVEEAPGHWGHMPPETFMPIVSAPPKISSLVFIMHACSIAKVARPGQF